MGPLSTAETRILRLDGRAVAAAASLPRPRAVERAIQLSAEALRGPLWVLLALTGPLPRGGNRFRPMLSTLATYSATLGAEALLKNVIRRQRPGYGDHKDAESPDVGDRYSFPSGHAMGAFAAAVALGASRPSRRPRYLVTASLVGVSRLYLGIHYPSDVLGGALLGVLVGNGVVGLVAGMEGKGRQVDHLLLATTVAGMLTYLIGRER